MTRVYNDPTDFRAEVIDGFSAAYSRLVRRVPNASGFSRLNGPKYGKVSLVVGGGSGHYPSYAGIVGNGLADGCVLGDIFTSPSAEQVYRIGTACAGDSGLILSFGNYAGDRLNFAAARDRLVNDGIDTRIVYVTDDIASAAPADIDKRRGIAGTMAVYKIGGAAADRGLPIDDVERIMQTTNAATFSFGVAFDGCTLPGQGDALFHVEPGKMELGLGIHGEPGIETTEAVSADALASILVDKVLSERPTNADGRAIVLVNGLGATKYEELFVVYRAVDKLLRAAGVQPILPEVGEMVTSLDMAGCSLSLTWLDDELQSLWEDPVDTAAFRRGAPDVDARFESMPERELDFAVSGGGTINASSDSIRAANKIREALDSATQMLVENEVMLGELDAIAGDGDHGRGMVRGFTAALDAVDGHDQMGAGTLLRSAGDNLADKAGGTSGILWGILLSDLGDRLGDQDEITANSLAAAMAQTTATFESVSKAQVGDKTMLDALRPFVDQFNASVSAGASIAEAWNEAASVATEAAQNTADLRPKLGRARPLAERSVGTPDPGAVSMAMILTDIGTLLGSD